MKNLPILRDKVEALTIRGKTDECWKWGGRHNAQGYPMVTIPKAECGAPKKEITVGKAICSIGVDRLLDSKVERVRQSCGNIRCVNATHLEITDKYHMVGRRCTSNMTWEKAEEIRATYAEGNLTQQQISEVEDVNISVVSSIIRYESWVLSPEVFPGKGRRVFCMQDARDLRELWESGAFTQSELAREVGITASMVNKIVKNLRWRERE